MRERIGLNFENIKEGAKSIPRAGVIFVAEKAAAITQRVLLPRVETTIIAETKVNFLPGFEDRFKFYIENDYAFIGNSNHTTQFDGKSIVAFLRKIYSMSERLLPGKGIKGAQMLYAKSLEQSQGEFIKKISAPALEELHADGLYPLPFVRPEEINTLLNEGKFDKVTEANILNKSSLRKLITAVKRNKDMIVTFAEATVKGGRRKGKFSREIYGLQKAKPNTLFSMYENLAKINDNKVVFLPIGMFGGHYIFSANHKLPTLRGIRVVMGLGRADLITINVGMPIDASEIIRELGDNMTEERFNDAVMKRVVPLLPEKAQGVYRRDKQVV